MSRTPPAAAEAANRLLEEGVAASRANDPERAMSLFVQAEAAAPGWAAPHFVIASEHAAAGNWALAEEEFAAAVLLEPRMDIARYQLGLLQYSRGRPAIAQVTWQPLLDPPREDGLDDFVRGFAALAGNGFDAARSAFRAGLVRPQVNPAVAEDIAQVLAQLPEPAQGQAGSAAPSPTGNAAAHVLVANYTRLDLH